MSAKKKQKEEENRQNKNSWVELGKLLTIFSVITGIFSSIYGLLYRFYESVIPVFSIWLVLVIISVLIKGLIELKIPVTNKRKRFGINLYFGAVQIVLLALLFFFLIRPPCFADIELIPEGKTGILVADFTEGENNIATRKGTEKARETAKSIKERLLDENIIVRSICPIRNEDEARKIAEEKNAEVVIWGRLSEFTEGSVTPFFYIHNDLQEELGDLQILQTDVKANDADLPAEFAKRAEIVISFVIGNAFMDLAEEKGDLRNYQMAWEEFNNAIQIQEEYADLSLPANRAILAVLYVLRGEAYWGMEDSESAFKDFDDAKSYRSEYAPAYIATANILYAQGKYQKAHQEYQQSIAYKKTMSGYFGLGITSFYLAEYQNSIKFLKEALSRATEQEKNVIRLFIGEVSRTSDMEVGFALSELQNVIDSDMASSAQKESAEILLDDLRGNLQIPTPTFTPTVSALSTAAVTPSGTGSSSGTGSGTSADSSFQPTSTNGLVTMIPPPNVPIMLPATGFPYGQISKIPIQPAEKKFIQTDNMVIEIPKIGIQTTIVGVPYVNNIWDVTWLGTNAGYLDWTTYPTHKGNSVITGHVWNADNTPGVFADLKELIYGDQFMINAWGETYVFEIRENELILPTETSSVFDIPSDYSWITLLTCEGFSEDQSEYLYRRIVRAVLIAVE